MALCRMSDIDDSNVGMLSRIRKDRSRALLSDIGGALDAYPALLSGRQGNNVCLLITVQASYSNQHAGGKETPLRICEEKQTQLCHFQSERDSR
jgi:hypothetical protein